MAGGKFTNDISCVVCENRNEPNPPADPGVCKHCEKAQRLHNLELVRKDFGVTNKSSLHQAMEKCYEDIYTPEEIAKLAGVDELHNNRQSNKKLMGPPELMEIFGYQLQIGREKGYKDDSWKQYLDDGSDLLPSISRHLIELSRSNNDGFYNEYTPEGDVCPTEANHAYALFWNAAVWALRVYNRSKKNHGHN